MKLSPFGHQLASGAPQAWAELLGRPVRQVTTCRPHYKGSSSQLRRLDVSLESGSRLAVLVKFTNSYEVRVYRDLATHLPLNVPHAYYTEGSLCILEALPPAKPITAWSEQDERLVLGDLARMHASFWCSPELDNYPWLTWLQDELNVRLDKAERGLRLMHEVGGWPGLITPHTLEVMEALLADRARLFRPLADLPLTLIHCDTWQPNWVLLDDRRILLDWQSAARGPAVWDVTYFLEMSGEAGGRLPLEESQALNAYWDALAAALHDSPQPFADDRVRHEFWSAAPAVSVISTLTRWPMYAVDYLRPVERFPALARVWKGLPHGLRRRIEARIIWTDLEYYRQMFARFEERARTVYGV